MATSIGQLAIGLGAVAAAYPLTRKWDNYVDQKRKADEAVDLSYDSKRQRLSSGFVSSGNMAFRPRFRRRRMFRRRRFRRKFIRARRRAFRRAVKRVVLKTAEPQKIVAANFSQGFAEEDAAGPLAYVACPPSVLVQGDQDDQFTGNKVWIKGMLLRGHIFINQTTPGITAAMVIVTAVFTKEQGTGFQGGFIPFSSTTTSSTNPAQTAPDVNPRFFDAAGSSAFTGNKFDITFDSTNVKVLRQWKIPINFAGDVEGTLGAMPTLIKLYCPINRMVQIEDAGQQGMTTGTRRFKHGSWYYVLKVITGVAGGLNDTAVSGDFSTQVFIRDP